ncbi:DUF5722 domain-containing protein [Roseibacillus ishigakijimensis]|uniref:DUF5722 domain-containing protein n=1 Tax=Roseibacillus ishigakijimensis TaxID=454146 RepID=A0A934RP42_9BACT|nr:DUF5722 domain-containing protein [Roseibacillus ishigakijimensis]MBK1833232.1 hypothetical protein [Roseibacillus ishigakijimensis]
MPAPRFLLFPLLVLLALPALAGPISAYLAKDYPARITRVEVAAETITLRFDLPPGLTEVELGAFAFHQNPAKGEAPLASHPLPSRHMTIPRYPQGSAGPDRLLTRWQLGQWKDGQSWQPLSSARYADVFPSQNPELPDLKPRSKKGLGGWIPVVGPASDLDELGIASLTWNILLHNLLAPKSGPHTEPFTWQGQTYHARLDVLAQHDRALRAAYEREIVVDAILLLPPPSREGADSLTRLLGHPDCEPGAHYAMPNMNDPSAVAHYGAALHLLATRYSRPDGRFGRIHHYIVHNEVDFGHEWTNCGHKALPEFFELYHRSLRLVNLVTRSQNPPARPFISLTHHWAQPGHPRGYGSRALLLELQKWTAAEGDFPWALAFHPYPANLRNPRTWEDPVGDDFNSAKITPKNIAVLDRWMKTPAMRDAEGRYRPVHLSENGCNSPDYSPASLHDQAAGTAFAWKSIQDLETITSWHNHRWFDHRREGGLRLGLRRFPDDDREPLGKKPVWHLYRALGSEHEARACAPFAEILP